MLVLRREFLTLELQYVQNARDGIFYSMMQWLMNEGLKDF